MDPLVQVIFGGEVEETVTVTVLGEVLVVVGLGVAFWLVDKLDVLAPAVMPLFAVVVL